MSDEQAEAVADAWIEGRRWLRCSGCGFVHDAKDDDAPEMALEVEDGRVVAVVCGLCSEEE